MAQTLEELIEKYKLQRSSLTEKEKAEFERDLWRAMSDRHGRGISKKHERREWFHDMFGEPPNAYSDRCALLNAPWAELLWERLADRRISRSTAMNLFRQTKNLARQTGGSLEEALSTVLENYDSTGFEVRLPGGTVSKRRTGSLHPPPSVPPLPDVEVTHSKEFYKQLRQLSERFLSTTLQGIDPYEATKLAEEFTGWVREAYDDLRRKAQSLRKDNKREAQQHSRITRSIFRSACEILLVKGTFGKPIDLKDAKRRMHQRAFSLHPDRAGDSPATRKEYEAVIEAYRVLEQYSEET